MINHTGFVTDESIKTVDRQRPANQVIIKVKSSPVGIDWRMIRMMKEPVRRRKNS